MVLSSRNHQSLTAPHQPQRLLLSATNAVTTNRIRAHMTAAGIGAEESDVGLAIPCTALDWRAVLESIGVGLSPAERRDTRVAVIRSCQDAADMHRSIFRAQSLEEMLGGVHEQWLDDVLKNDRIAIHFQPIVQFPPGRLHGYECLMRGIDADGALIPPTRVLEAARRLGQLPLLDQKCRLAAIRAAAPLAGTGLTFFINVIPSAMARPRIQLAEMMQELQSRGLRPQEITLEIVETDQISNHRELLNILQYYRKAGFRVALDDVGAGYSSLLSLARLRPDYIKLDGELVRQAATSALEAKMVADLAETARQNGIITIAEGVETPHQFRLILASGIRLTQGYFHAKPRQEPLHSPEIQRLAARAARAAAPPTHGRAA
ncbi:MAG: EAL domain-containing protein [Planctomycetota bacterium]|nr:EAL domain-containing protein [Planctomycetota bacterium]